MTLPDDDYSDSTYLCMECGAVFGVDDEGYGDAECLECGGELMETV